MWRGMCAAAPTTPSPMSPTGKLSLSSHTSCHSCITNVSNSGQSLLGKDYLYFDWVRTAKILGESSLTSVLTSTGLVANFSELLGAGQEFGSNTVARDFCVQEAYKTTSKLRRGEGEVVRLDGEEVHYSEEDREVSTLPGNMRGIVISKQLLQNDTAVVALLQTDGSIKVWRTSKGENFKLTLADLWVWVSFLCFQCQGS